MHYRYDMASNHWQEEPHVPKETHLPSIELNTLETKFYHCLNTCDWVLELKKNLFFGVLVFYCDCFCKSLLIFEPICYATFKIWDKYWFTLIVVGHDYVSLHQVPCHAFICIKNSYALSFDLVFFNSIESYIIITNRHCYKWILY